MIRAFENHDVRTVGTVKNSNCPKSWVHFKFHDTKPLEPLIIGPSAFWLHVPGVRNRSPTGVHFFQGVNRSLFGQGFTFLGFTFLEPLKIKERSRIRNRRTGDSMNGSLDFVKSAGKM